MKIAIYSPYLDTFGGGERYIATIAEVLSGSGDVDIFLDEHLFSFGGQFLKKGLEDRFGLNLSNADFIKAPVGKRSNFLQRLLFLKQYDLLFYLTDGSIFISSAKRNILHIQTPLVGQAKSLWGKFKLNAWNLVVYNSEFTQKYSKKNWSIKSKVIYPPVDVARIRSLKKKKYILSVGRFFGYLKNKKHEFLIKMFRKIYDDKKLDGWSLHLAGSLNEGDESYLEQLKKLSQNLPVNFYPNLGYDELIKLYGQSSIYWHAQGFEEGDPTKMEHFGISTVEAMAGGCVPVVIKGGGQIEIVEHGKSGYLWNSLKELKEFTLKVVESISLWQVLSKQAMIKAKSFDKEKFKQNILSII